MYEGMPNLSANTFEKSVFCRIFKSIMTDAVIG